MKIMKSWSGAPQHNNTPITHHPSPPGKSPNPTKESQDSVNWPLSFLLTYLLLYHSVHYYGLPYFLFLRKGFRTFHGWWDPVCFVCISCIDVFNTKFTYLKDRCMNFLCTVHIVFSKVYRVLRLSINPSTWRLFALSTETYIPTR